MAGDSVSHHFWRYGYEVYALIGAGGLLSELFGGIPPVHTQTPTVVSYCYAPSIVIDLINSIIRNLEHTVLRTRGLGGPWWG
jgi:hypothetical protein